MKLQKTVVTDKPRSAVFDYHSDFTTTTEWDPGTVVTVNHHGDGRAGTTYLNTSTFLGRKTQLTYIVREFIPGERIRLRGENKTVIAVDTMTFRSIDAAPRSPTQPSSPSKARPVSSPRCSGPPSNGSANKRTPAFAQRSTSSDQPGPAPHEPTPREMPRATRPFPFGIRCFGRADVTILRTVPHAVSITREVKAHAGCSVARCSSVGRTGALSIVERIPGAVDYLPGKARPAPSARVGMWKEAHFVENEWFKGRWSDELVYAILAREWQARQARSAS